MSMKTCLIFMGLLSFLRTAEGYISGAPTGACDSMVPGHGVASQPMNASPYSITTSSQTYSCNETVTIQLTGTVPFKGFLCQIRASAATYETYGTLTTTGNVPTTTNCGSNVASLTHTNNDNKTGVTFTWQPNSNQAQVYAVCTIVQKLDTLWVKQVSSPITYAGGECILNNNNNNNNNNGNGSDMTSSIRLGILIFGLLMTTLFQL